MTECNPQIELFSIGRRTVTLTAEGRHVTSNAGVLLAARAERRLRLAERLSRVLSDGRVPHLVRHTLEEQFRQRLLQIVCGYEDANDATSLRHEAAFQTAMGRVAGTAEAELASQPTLSRFEQRTEQEIRAMSEVLIDLWVDRLRGKRQRRVILDSDDPTHGAQQLSMFHGYYDQTMYHPLLVFDGEGWPVAVMLRAGNAHASAGAVEVLDQIIAKLPRGVRVLLRADAGFATPQLYTKCEKLGVDYLIGQNVHVKYKAITARLFEEVCEEFGRTGKPVKRYMEFPYQAKKRWKRARRIIAKIEATAQHKGVRYVVTSLEQRTPKELYERGYCGRGQSENYIKELKNALFADRLSCTAFVANEFRLLLHTAAYILMFDLREQLADTALRRVQLDTLRLKLLKVGASIVVTARRVWVYLSTYDPARPIFETLARSMAASPG